MLLVLHQEAARQLPGPVLVGEPALRLALRRSRMLVVDGGKAVVGAERGQASGELSRPAALRAANVVVEGG